MNRFPPLPSTPDDDGEDRLLRRYHEANALDDATPGPALREAVLAHARSVAAARKNGVPAHAGAPASNDSSWTLRALGSLAVLGLVGLLVLQFDRGSPEEREVAFGEPAAPTDVRHAPAAEPENPTAGEPAPALAGRREGAPVPSLKTPHERPNAGRAPAPMAAAPAHDSIAETLPSPAAPMAAPSAEAREPVDNTAVLRREGPAADRARIAAAMPPLLAAAAQGDPEAVRHLLAAGADVNTRDSLGRTALIFAAQRGDAALIRLLLAAGADPQRQDSEGLRAADHAERTGQTAVLPLLR